MEQPLPFPVNELLALDPDTDEAAAAPDPGLEDDDTTFWDNMIFPI